MVTNIYFNSKPPEVLKVRCRIHFSEVSEELIQTLKFLWYSIEKLVPYAQSVFMFPNDTYVSPLNKSSSAYDSYIKFKEITLKDITDNTPLSECLVI